MEHRPKSKHKIIKLLEENRKSICAHGLGKDFLDITPKAYPLKKLVSSISKVKISAIWKILLRNKKSTYKPGNNICKMYLLKDYIHYIIQ